MKRSCDRCGGGYDARSPRSRFCSAACRVAAGAARKKGLPERVGEVVDLPTSEGTTLRLTRERLEAAGLMGEPKAGALLVLAGRIDAASDSGSSLAALVREHGAKLDELARLVPAAADPVDELKARRERRLSG